MQAAVISDGRINENEKERERERERDVASEGVNI
jgi:hypothetical protein